MTSRRYRLVVQTAHIIVVGAEREPQWQRKDEHHFPCTVDD